MRLTRIHYRKYKPYARALVMQKIAQWGAVYEFTPIGRISIRNQRTRWGSCSRRGNLNFNWRIVLLPERIQDYLIVHELCHLAEFNHSPRFWALVAHAVPEYKELRRELKRPSLSSSTLQMPVG